MIHHDIGTLSLAQNRPKQKAGVTAQREPVSVPGAHGCCLWPSKGCERLCAALGAPVLCPCSRPRDSAARRRGWRASREATAVQAAAATPQGPERRWPGRDADMHGNAGECWKHCVEGQSQHAQRAAPLIRSIPSGKPTETGRGLVVALGWGLGGADEARAEVFPVGVTRTC